MNRSAFYRQCIEFESIFILVKTFHICFFYYCISFECIPLIITYYLENYVLLLAYLIVKFTIYTYTIYDKERAQFAIRHSLSSLLHIDGR